MWSVSRARYRHAIGSRKSIYLWAPRGFMSIVDGTRVSTCWVHMLAPRAGSPCCRLADLSLGSYFGLTYRLRGSRMVARSRGEAEESGASCAAGARGWPVCFAGRVNMLAGQSGLRVRAPVARKQARCARPRHASREPSDSPCLPLHETFFRRVPVYVLRERAPVLCLIAARLL